MVGSISGLFKYLKCFINPKNANSFEINAVCNASEQSAV